MQTILTSEMKIVPVFFAVDDTYAPYLSVALRSLIEHSSPSYQYHIHILIDTLSDETQKKLLSMQTKNVCINFVPVREKLARYMGKLHLRDYYTQATYYRFVISELFPEYDRCLYLDCDILVLNDVAKLYEAELGDALLGAVADDVVANLSFFRDYVGEFLGVPYEKYFNAGILVLNLFEMRRADMSGALVNVMNERTFPVAQDQDYLNVLCYGRTAYLDGAWNKTAFPDAEQGEMPNIVHFKINFKPWHYDDISFGAHFWQCAKRTPFYHELQAIRAAYTDELRARDAGQYERLVALATAETAKVNAAYIVPTVFSVAAMKGACI